MPCLETKCVWIIALPPRNFQTGPALSKWSRLLKLCPYPSFGSSRSDLNKCLTAGRKYHFDPPAPNICQSEQAGVRMRVSVTGSDELTPNSSSTDILLILSELSELIG